MKLSELKELRDVEAVLLRELFDEAVRAFPYVLLKTEITMGKCEADENGFAEYSEEFTFFIVKVIDKSVVAGGWIDLRLDDGDIWIGVNMGLSFDGDFKKGRLLKDDEAIQGNYDFEEKKWEELYIDSL